MRYLLLTISLILLQISAQTQSVKEDTTNSWMRSYTMSTRSYFMTTQYYNDFKPDHAWGQMLSVQVKQQLGNKLSVAASYAGFVRILSSDLQALDTRVPILNRYEVGLFDVTDLDQRVFGRVENLHLSYTGKNFQAKLGRMGINTPFLNPQDGRLSPTFVEGWRLDWKLDQRVSLSSDLIWRISPRSTGEWFGVGESIGLYPVGRDVNGGPSAYAGQTTSAYVHVTDLSYKPSKNTSWKVNHTLIDNITSTYLIQYEGNKKIESITWLWGLQTTVQHGIGNGGNDDPALRYKSPDDFNTVLSGRIGFKTSRAVFNINYSKMVGGERFLSPREWGRDPFYTFIPRERNEGLTAVDAFTLYYQQTLDEQSTWQAYGYGGIYLLPEATDFELNKYAFPSYTQFNLGLKHSPSKWGAGLNFHLILMTKLALEDEIAPAWEYNKVNLFHLNAIVNYSLNW